MPALDASTRAILVVCTGTLQLAMGLYLLVCGLVAYEMSGMLSAALLPYAIGVLVAGSFLLGRRRWAWYLSLGLSALALIAGLGLSLLPPAWVGSVHAAGAAMVIAGLWAIRPLFTIPEVRPQ